MKVLMINGSPRRENNTSIALGEMEKVFAEEGIDVELVNVGTKDVRGCIACNKCSELGKCVFDDIVNECAAKLAEADGLVVGTPVYYASANGSAVSLMDRLFYSTPFPKRMKVGAVVTSARRAGTITTFDQLNHFFTLAEMPVASSRYWNEIHGNTPEQANQDEEGKQIMRVLGRNMAFLVKAIAAEKEKNGLPEQEPARIATNFIR